MPLEAITMRDIKLLHRNFKGREGKWNPEGVRNFLIVLPPDVAQELQEDGWNVKFLEPRAADLEEDPNAQGVWFLPVECAYNKGRPPRIFQITERGRTAIYEDTVALLDDVDILRCDMVVNPHEWGNKATGDSGVKAYLRSAYITIAEDELEREYAHLDLQ